MDKNKGNLLSQVDWTNAIVLSTVKENLNKIGEKGGQKFSDLVDKAVDAIFKSKK